MDYQKVIPQSGNGQFGGTVTFSIPQYGDFFSDMALNITVGQASASAGALPAVPADSAVIVAANN